MWQSPKAKCLHEIATAASGFAMTKFHSVYFSSKISIMRTEQRESPCKPKLSGLFCVVRVQGFGGKTAKNLAHFARALRCSCENTHCLHV